MAIFAQPSPDENLVPGWNNQGDTSPGYAEAAATSSVTVVGQAGAGYPNPPGAIDVGAENSGSYGESILENGSYSVSPTTNLSQTLTTPVPSTAGVQNPFGTAAIAQITSGSATTAQVAPFTTGTVTYGSAQTVADGVTAILVPPGGYIKTAAAVTSVIWLPTN
jgi:hypothetical protein